MNPILSVIIPCYNNGGLLIEMLDCCLNQTFKGWEVIIVDDGSTDDTLKIIESYLKRDNRVKIYKREREPKGSVICRNIGFENSCGKYIIHFDADDLISNTCFENRVAFMEKHAECDYASFPAKKFTDRNKLPKITDGGEIFGVPHSGDLLKDFLTYDYSFSVWCNIYKRTAIESLQWDEKVSIYTDFSFIVPCILKGLNHEFANVGELDYFYRVSYTPVNMCSSFVNDKKCESTLYLFNKTLLSLQQREDYLLRKKQFYVYITIHLNRLVLSGNYERVNEFIEMCSRFYDKRDLSRLKIFAKTFMKKHEARQGKGIDPLELYFWCTICYKTRRYLNCFIRNLLKVLTWNSQTLYQ